MKTTQHQSWVHRQAGFTIVELLIATAILSTILVMVTTVMTAIGNLYQKGVNQARVQDAVRSINDDVSQHLQLTSGNWHGDGTANDGAICVGNTRYTYVIGKKIGSQPGESKHVLWRETIPLATDCRKADLSQDPPASSAQPGVAGTGVELIPPNSRLIAFDIVGTSPYTFRLTIAYGENDLFDTPSGDFVHRDVTCKGGNGDQFCATATSYTTIVQRL